VLNFRLGTSISNVLPDLLVEIIVCQAVASHWGHIKLRLPFVCFRECNKEFIGGDLTMYFYIVFIYIFDLFN
jgi:hypothetical protein